MHLEREGIFLGLLRCLDVSPDIIVFQYFRGYSMFLCSRNNFGPRAFAPTGILILQTLGILLTLPFTPGNHLQRSQA